MREPPKRWTELASDVHANVEKDVALLREAFPFCKLPADHPVRNLWSEASERARFTLHHLADDIRMVQGVPGAKGLLKSLRRDRDGFEDFRYELRIGAAIGRAAGQQLLRLGGPNAGPDIEFTSRSGHRCGVACYRARSATPAVADLRKSMRSIARTFFRRFYFYPVPASLLIEAVLPRVPLNKTDAATASNLLYDFWLRLDVGELERDGIRVKRLQLPELPRVPEQRRRARLRFLVPLPEAERSRVVGQLGQKVPKEVSSWASAYAGVPVFAVEESDGVHNGRLRKDIEVTMGDASHAFAGVLLTYYPTQGIESIEWVPRKGPSLGLDIGVETFGANLGTWSDGRPVVSLTPDCATEEWEFVQTTSGSSSELVKSLSLGSHYVRLPPLRDSTRRPTEDPDFEPNLKAAIERMQQEQQRLLLGGGGGGFTGFLPDGDAG